MKQKIVGYVCIFCNTWYEDTDAFQCFKCKEYKGMTPVTQEQWDEETY